MAFRLRYLIGLSATIVLFLGGVPDICAAGSFVPIQKDPVEESWRWRSFHELEGQGLSCLTEGPDGSVLFGTDEGVRVYNGVKWGVYRREDGIVGAPVNTLLTTSHGSVYAGTETSLLRLNGSQWEVVFPTKGDLHWRFTDLEEAQDGSIWAATNWGALRLQGKKSYLYTTDAIGKSVKRIAPYIRLSVVPERYVPERTVHSRIGLLTAPAGFEEASALIVYAVTEGGPGYQVGVRVGDRIAAVDGHRLADPNTALVGPPGTVVDLQIIREGFDEPMTFEVIRKEEEDSFRPFAVHDVLAARDGSVWFGLETGDVLQFQFLLKGKGATGLWRLHTEADGLTPGDLPKIGQSPDGQIWTVSYNQRSGLNRFDGIRWHHTRLSALTSGSDLNTSFATTPDGSFWVGGNALSVLRDGTWFSYSNPDLFPDHRSRLLVTADGALWVAGLGQHVSRFSSQSSRWTSHDRVVFQTESPDGSQWFLADDNGVVKYDGTSWMRYGTEDGMPEAPSAVRVTRPGVVWVIGSHLGVAATSIQTDAGWDLQTHPALSWNIEHRAWLEAADGSVWVGAWVDVDPDKGQIGGVLQYQDGSFTHHTPPDAPEFSYGIAQTDDGLLWFCGEELRLYDGRVWLTVLEPDILSRGWTDAIHTTAHGDLWVGTRTHGVLRYADAKWSQYTRAHGLAGNRIFGISGEGDSLWVSTNEGVSRFDGSSWVTRALPAEIESASSGLLQVDRQGNVWVSSQTGFRNRVKPGISPAALAEKEIWTIRYQPDRSAPETEITLGTDRISRPGNTVFAWRGFDRFKDTPDDELQFAWRLNGGAWSAFDTQTFNLFRNLEDGRYRLDVVARDRDLNTDATPASFEFRVGPMSQASR
jgi:hypothetical protein